MIDCKLNLDMKVEIHDCSTNYEFDVIIRLFNKNLISLLIITCCPFEWHDSGQICRAFYDGPRELT